MENEYKGYLYLLITFILWGSMYVVTKFVMGKVPTFTVAFFRYLISFIALSILSLNKDKATITKEDQKYIFIIGFLGYFFSVGLQLLGTKIAGASMASLINSLNPVFIGLMATLILKEQLTKERIIGIIFSFVGVYLIVGGNRDTSVLGIALSLFAVVGWSFMSVTTRKIGHKYDTIIITRNAIGIAAFFNLFAAACEILITHQTVKIDITVILSLLYIGLICTALTNVLWNKSLILLPANICSEFYPVQTLVSSVLGIFLLKETLKITFVFGSALIIAGILISLLMNKKVEELTEI